MVPFLVLGLLIGGITVSFIQWLSSQTAEERLRSRLAVSSQQTQTIITSTENDLLRLQRSLVHTEGMVGGILQKDAEEVRQLALPVLVNAGMDMVSVLDDQGLSIVTLRRVPEAAVGSFESVRNEDFFADWPIVTDSISPTTQSEAKPFYAALHYIEAGGEGLNILAVSGPVLSDSDEVVGAIVTGQYMPNLTLAVSQSIGGHFTIYEPLEGRVLSTSREDDTAEPLTEGLLVESLSEGTIRAINIGDQPYREVLSSFELERESKYVGSM